ncbi:hypothetical protein [Actinocrispum sp. NPDC049592]|uniref:hypothetical protein n=1 Tax=Actinocrispum sp. NPDC049592 TaxID=3154835 RepID=UPI003433C762
MTLEDQLRDRLRAETAELRPPGDLLDTLSRGHARRFKRARLTLAGGSLAATAVVAVLLVGLLASPPAPPARPPQPLNVAEVLQRAREADAAATGKIIYFRVTNDAMYNVQEIWALRSERIGRATSDSGSDHKIVEDRVFRTGSIETVDYRDKTVRSIDVSNDEEVVIALMPPVIRDPKEWLVDPHLSVTQRGGEIHLISPGTKRPELYLSPFDVVLDPRTYLPVRGTFEEHLRVEITWLDATPENRERLAHTVPPDFRRR